MFKALNLIFAFIATCTSFSQNESVAIKWTEPFPVTKRAVQTAILSNASTIVCIETIAKGVIAKFHEKSFRIIDKKTMKTTFSQAFTREVTHYYKAVYIDNVLTDENLYIFGKMKKSGTYEYFVLIYDMQGKLVGNKPICTYKKDLVDKFRFIKELNRFHLHIEALYISKNTADIYFDKDLKELSRKEQKMNLWSETMAFETFSEDFKRCRFVKKYASMRDYNKSVCQYVLEIEDGDFTKAPKTIVLPINYYHVSTDIDFTFKNNIVRLTAFYRADFAGGNLDGIFYLEYDVARDKVIAHKEKLLDPKNFAKYMDNYTESKTASIRYLQAIYDGDDTYLVFEHVDPTGLMAQNLIVMSLDHHIELSKVNYVAKYTSLKNNSFYIPYPGCESIASFLYKGKPTFLYNDLPENAKTNNPQKIGQVLFTEGGSYGLVLAVMDQNEVKKKLLFENAEMKVVVAPNAPKKNRLDVADLVFKAFDVDTKNKSYKIGMLVAP